MNFLKSERGISLCKLMGGVVIAAALAVYGAVTVWRIVPGIGDYFHGIVLATLALGILMTMVLGWLCFFRRVKIEKAYPVAALFLAVMTFLALPTYSKPDEQLHFETAYELSNRMVGEEVYTDEWRFLLSMRACDNEYTGTGLSVEQYNWFGSLYTTNEQGEQTDDYIRNHSSGDILAYLIPAAGITVGRWFHLGFSGVAAMGTLFQTVFFILMITYAMHKLPFGKRTLFVIALLPMTLQQACSFSYDSVLISAGSVATSLAVCWAEKIRAAEQREKEELSVKTGILARTVFGVVAVPEAALFALSTILLLSVKAGIYVLLVLLPIFSCFSWQKFKTWMKARNHRLIFAGILALLAAAVVFLLIFGGVGQRLTTLNVRPYVAWADAYGFSVAEYITHPFYTLKVLAHTCVEKGPYYVQTLLGGLLGWLDITISSKVLLLVLLFLLLSLVRSPEEKQVLKRSGRIGFLLTAMAIVLLSVLGMLFYWTPMFSPVVEGVQGRYFLPPLLAALLAVGFWKRPVWKRPVDDLFVLGMSLLDFAVIICIYINIITK